MAMTKEVCTSFVLESLGLSKSGEGEPLTTLSANIAEQPATGLPYSHLDSL